MSNCHRTYDEDIKDCPCQSGCPSGCPCPNYPCTETTISPDITTPSQPDTTTSPTADAVLILNTASSSNMPMVVDFDGQWIVLYF